MITNDKFFDPVIDSGALSQKTVGDKFECVYLVKYVQSMVQKLEK